MDAKITTDLKCRFGGLGYLFEGVYFSLLQVCYQSYLSGAESEGGCPFKGGT